MSLFPLGRPRICPFCQRTVNWRGRFGEALVVDENTLSTNIPGIFAGGDFTTGPTYVIRAIASGRRAAFAIDKISSGETRAV